MPQAAFIPSGVPQGLLNLIQNDKLSGQVLDTMFPYSKYIADFMPAELPMGIGSTIAVDRISGVAPNLTASDATGSVDVLTFTSERMTASPKNFSRKVEVDAPTAYIQTAGSRFEQSVSRLALWAALTSGRSARQRLFQTALAGQAMIRTAQTTSDSQLRVNNCSGFRFVWVSGVPTAVSGSNTLGITIVAASTFTALVTGVTPDDTNFPDGPGTLTLSTTLSANVAAGSYCYVTGARPYIVRPNARASSDAILSTDLPTMAEIRKMKAKLVDQGVPPHASTGTYHLHVGPSFFDAIGSDTAYRQAVQGMGPSPLLGPGTLYAAGLGITFIENNDSPALGKTDSSLVVQVGGTPGSSQTFKEIGADVVNAIAVTVHRAIMTGGEVGTRWYVNEGKYIELAGGQKIGQVTESVAAYLFNGMTILEVNLGGWRMIVRPPLDDRMLISTVTMSSTFDFLAATDVNCLADTADLRPYKRGIALEYGYV